MDAPAVRAPSMAVDLRRIAEAEGGRATVARNATGIHLVVRFPNSLGASVIYHYAAPDVVELATVAFHGPGHDDWGLVYDTPVTSDVERMDSPEQLSETLWQISELEGRQVYVRAGVWFSWSGGAAVALSWESHKRAGRFTSVRARRADGKFTTPASRAEFIAACDAWVERTGPDGIERYRAESEYGKE